MGLRYFNSVPENNSLFTLIQSSALIVRVGARKLTTFGSMPIKLNLRGNLVKLNMKSLRALTVEPDSMIKSSLYYLLVL